MFIFLNLKLEANTNPVTDLNRIESFWSSKLWENNFIKETTPEESSESIPGRYPKWAKTILNLFFGWELVQDSKQPLSCDARSLRNHLSRMLSPEEKYKYFNEQYDKCSPVRSKNNLINILKNISQRYDYLKNPLYKKITLHFPGGIKTKALFAFKDKTPRDLLIFRPGIFASTDDIIAEKYLLKIFFELSEFNLIVLESSSSPDHMYNNAKIYLGGVKEGLENLYLIKQLRAHTGFSVLIKKINLIGMSLGGNGVLFASYMNQLNQYQFFHKTLLMCPVVDLNRTFDEAKIPRSDKYITDLWVSRRFGEAFSKRNIITMGFMESLFSLSPRYIPSYYELAKNNYYLDPALYQGFSPNLYSGNYTEDLNFYQKLYQLPQNFYYLATKSDELVNPNINFKYIKNRESGKEFIHLFTEGIHCSFAYAYDWEFIKSLLLGILE